MCRNEGNRSTSICHCRTKVNRNRKEKPRTKRTRKITGRCNGGRTTTLPLTVSRATSCHWYSSSGESKEVEQDTISQLQYNDKLNAPEHYTTGPCKSIDSKQQKTLMRETQKQIHRSERRKLRRKNEFVVDLNDSCMHRSPINCLPIPIALTDKVLKFMLNKTPKIRTQRHPSIQ
jgi:hypothetical protein